MTSCRSIRSRGQLAPAVTQAPGNVRHRVLQQSSSPQLPLEVVVLLCPPVHSGGVRGPGEAFRDGRSGHSLHCLTVSEHCLRSVLLDKVSDNLFSPVVLKNMIFGRHQAVRFGTFAPTG